MSPVLILAYSFCFANGRSDRSGIILLFISWHLTREMSESMESFSPKVKGQRAECIATPSSVDKADP